LLISRKEIQLGLVRVPSIEFNLPELFNAECSLSYPIKKPIGN
jgi:hypothetical protein